VTIVSFLFLSLMIVVLMWTLRRERDVVGHLRGEQARLQRELAQMREEQASVRGVRRIAHDLNNVLGMIGGYAQLLRRGMAPADPLKARVEGILKATERASGMTRDLSELSHTLDADEPVRPPAVTAAPVPDDKPTILLVEDEASLREILSEVLNDAGYRVLSAGAAGDALAAVQAHRGPIHLMLADVNLPGTSGPELAAQLQFLHAAARVLYMSGHGEDAIARRSPLHPASPLLQKPFTPTTLLQRVRESLLSAIQTSRVPMAVPELSL
jgi:CheY-like chemotaxis protein